MRRLRSAQLGKSINVAQTTQLLELALPEIDVELLAGVGGKLDELESLRGELAALREADGAAARFVDRYREFARGVVARELGAADDVVRAARRGRARSSSARRAAPRRRGRVAARRAGPRPRRRADRAHARASCDALHASERWQAVEQVGAAASTRADQDERARRAEARVEELLDEVAELGVGAARPRGRSCRRAERRCDAGGARRCATPARAPGSPTC